MNTRQGLRLLNDLNSLVEKGTISEEHLGDVVSSLSVTVRSINQNEDYLEGLVQGLRIADQIDRDVLSVILRAL